MRDDFLHLARRLGGMSESSIGLTLVEPTQGALLEAIVALADANRATLGYIPWGAWPGFAEKQNLIAAQAADGSLLGYALFSIALQRVRLIHLCVESASRGRGVARQLVDEIESRHQSLRGITAKCRPDYDANMMWPRLGFTPVNEVRGRSANSIPLTVWFRSHNLPDLFTPADDDAALVIALDHNVFLDLCVHRNRDGAAESQALEGDWLHDQVRLLTTPETLHEITRIPDGPERQRQRTAAISFGQLDVSATRLRRAADQLRSALNPIDVLDESDLMHVAYAAAAGASVLVTRDDEWIKKAADAAATEVGVRIMRPSDVVVHLDELQNAARYRPAALRGTQLSIQSIPASASQTLADLIDKAGSETRRAYNALLRSIAANPGADRRYVRVRDGMVLAAWVVTHHPNSRTTEVMYFRAATHPLAATVASLICFDVRRAAATAGSTRIVVSDKHVGQVITTILTESGYEPSDDGYVTYALPVMSAVEAQAFLPSGSAAALTVRSLPVRSASRDDLARLEHALWPAKMLDTQLPNYLVPIQPRWAHDLLGLKHALWDPPSLLGASVEHVYYRYHRANPLAPARILWYVSAQRGEIVREVVGCSLLRAVDLDEPERLFRRYHHFGVYTIEDIRTAGIEQVAALRFVDTELFNRAVSYARLKHLAAATNCRIGTIQSPTKISSALFGLIYEEACQPWKTTNAQS